MLNFRINSLRKLLEAVKGGGWNKLGFTILLTPYKAIITVQTSQKSMYKKMVYKRDRAAKYLKLQCPL
jgi:hypothetical protein